MKSPPVAPRRRAQDDIDAALRHYLDEGGVELALRFIDALEAAFAHLRSHLWRVLHDKRDIPASLPDD